MAYYKIEEDSHLGQRDKYSLDETLFIFGGAMEFLKFY